VSKGAAAQAERHCEDPRAATSVGTGSVALSAAEVRSLHAIIAELDTCRHLLGGEGGSAGTRSPRSKRAAMRT
jgi:hypothetical protein